MRTGRRTRRHIGLVPSLPARLRPSLLASLVPGLVAVMACADPQLRGLAVDPPRTIADFQFTLPTGAQYSTAPEAGRPTLVFFGYTHCPDVCPLTLADWKRAKGKLGARGDRVRYLFVTVDPERDSRPVAQRYAAQFDAAFMGLSGDSATTTGIMRAFDVSAARESSADSTNYFVSHSGQTFLVDDHGRLVSMYPLGMGWEALVHDLEILLSQ